MSMILSGDNGVTFPNNTMQASAVQSNSATFTGVTTLSSVAGQTPLVTQINGTEVARIDSSGNFIVGSSIYPSATSQVNVIAPANIKTEYYMLKNTQVEGHIGFKSGTDSNWYFNTGPSLGQYGLYQTNNGNSWNAVSDETLKTDLTPILNGLNKVNSLRALTGRYISDNEGTSRSFLIAQDVQKVLPEAVSIANQETGTLGLSYTDVIPLLVSSIKELKAIVDAQSIEIAELKTKVGN